MESNLNALSTSVHEVSLNLVRFCESSVPRGHTISMLPPPLSSSCYTSQKVPLNQVARYLSYVQTFPPSTATDRATVVGSFFSNARPPESVCTLKAHVMRRDAGMLLKVGSFPWMWDHRKTSLPSMPFVYKESASTA